MYLDHYDSPTGKLFLVSDGRYLIGLYMKKRRYCNLDFDSMISDSALPVFQEVKSWLDTYFSGRCPDFLPPLLTNGTEFQEEVWQCLLEIPFGQTTTYGEIAKKIASKKGIKSMSAQAVGGAVGRNPISIIIPCHRVVGSNGNLTGYAGGIENKEFLLRNEHIL